MEVLQPAVRYRPFPHPTSHTKEPGSRLAKNCATLGRIVPDGSSQFS